MDWSRGMNHLLKNLGYAEEGGRRAALNCLYLVSWPGRLRKSHANLMAKRMFVCSVCYAVMHTFLQGNWWMAGWLVLLCSLCCPHIVGEPTTGFFFLGLCAIWVVDQPILDSSCWCSTEVSVPFCWCCWCLLDSSVTIWCGSTTMVFCLPKPRFVDYLLVRCTFLISQPTIWGKPTQFWIGWIYMFFLFPVQ